jgi:predicted AAA+ superfamily ATPase
MLTVTGSGCPPMVQNLRDVPDLVGALRGAQDQIIVLIDVEAFAESADRLEEASPVDG